MKDLVELGSLALSAAKRLTIGAVKAFEDKKAETMDVFYSELFKGLVEEDIINYENEFIKPTQEYCYKLLNAALIDEEKEKAIYYSRLYKYILSNQSIVKSKKLNLLKTLKGLSFEAIQLLPILYVYQNYPTAQITSLREYVDNLIKNPDQSYDLNILSQFGILNQVQLAGGHTFEPSTLFDEFISIIFRQEDLSLQSLGIQVLEKKTLILIDTISGGTIQYIKTLISKEIEVSNYSHLFTDSNKIELKKFEHIICVVSGGYIEEYIVKKLALYKNIIKVSTDKIETDPLSFIQSKVYNIQQDNTNNINEFLSQIKE